MKLTGKLKKDFTDWYERTNYLENEESNITEMSQDTFWGNLQSFGDSVGYDLIVFRWHNKFTAMIYENNYRGLFDKEIWKNDKSKKRDQARERVITKFIEIYNEKL